MFSAPSPRRIIVALTPDDVTRLAGLARIELTADETATLAPQLEVILDAVASVSKVATAEVPPTSHALPLVNAFRPDEVKPSMPAEEALAMAPRAEQNRFRVPRILDQEAQG
ncbi:Asp-tRNA(Asn)/Glu-tRNA(Gln) amidotransferase subunit GatC [Acidipropionibacterium jensenii]|uniref:Aspartyl/glutamyl-tRNA(Asn/Gln) amidotransferase subunit C n=1 Tax=Acidipropionibacterium jensenii TaxID=1749 RepID=A0A3Q9UNL8_9ACTN|nr:Asp-tRNA(Asn)/Glu-tRNA(Gln) amidotransferase subunit GatC [Acidipropionibacterium jensenii]AZZ39515.1 Asp-tRNA(Asn)/Glu-tRNA(Gln) amidotransferase subunit GatC [Acidipropionibacterium jensenii]AZZ42073.1 Asp-tRNA(Asn)/Glu-tRNA(Gln) amidotransferase subunit GatC [Acidipropionibacterium jensenii]MDN5977058.1 Asp-tRNA(Asn)/Glu-tRNA(Gln) amidotransferase subunit GatC [Acidipropionibacterium jensenii]MDN5995793.1 Asp-tRNA(Asn)/Glu-tRNA(Gln) amidotransferase subunit GatC [Acidipropionibacterium je